MREVEKSCCGYIILGLPEKPHKFLLNFLIKKGIRPFVYTDCTRIISKLTPLARFMPEEILENNRAGVEGLERHTLDRRLRKITIICADKKFEGFIERNRARLEQRFIIQYLGQER